MRWSGLGRGSRSEAHGFTLVELLVSMALLMVISGIFLAATNSMFKDVRRQQGQSDNVNAGRKAVAELDKQVRYANAINTPGSGLAADGSQWVEWQQGGIGKGQQQTCVQWRWDKPTGRLLYRTWGIQLSDGSVANLTGWNVRSDGIAQLNGADIFSLPTPTDALPLRRAQLTVSFTSTHGSPPLKTETTITFTALNTSSADRLLVPVCQGEPRTP